MSIGISIQTLLAAFAPEHKFPATLPCHSFREQPRGIISSISRTRDLTIAAIYMAASLFTNTVFLSAFFSFFLAQLLKIFSYRFTDGVWDVRRVVSSGGMPSSHAAFVTGLTVGVGTQEGVDSSVFAMALVFSLIVMYDATGVRLHAGRQATALNMIISEMPPDHPIQDSGRLRDSLGHTKVQVGVGVIVGLGVGGMVQLFSR